MKMKITAITLILLTSCTSYDRSSDRNYSAAMNLYRQSIASETLAEKMSLRLNIVRLSPSSEYGLFSKGWMLYIEGDFKGSIELYTSAISLNPSEAMFYYNRAVSLLALFKDDGNSGHLTVASADLDRSIELNPAYSNSYSMRAETETLMKKYEAAVSDYTTAINLNPGDPQLWYNRGLLRLKRLNDSKGSISDASKALKLDPQFAAAFCLRGLAKLSLGDKKGACSDYRRAGNIDPDSCLFGGEGGIIPGCTD